LLQQGDLGQREPWNRFNGFLAEEQTVKTVISIRSRTSTGLKPGVNERRFLRPGISWFNDSVPNR
jgi:hypothetical protein